MKRVLIERMRAWFLVFFYPCASLACSLAKASAQALQTITISPEVKADLAERLETAKSWNMPKQDKFVQHKGYVSEKVLRKICNGVPNRDYTYTQSEACSRYMGDVHFQTLDDLMPEFKACALDTTECSHLAGYFERIGRYDYAIATIEAGYAQTRVVKKPNTASKDIFGNIYVNPQSLVLEFRGLDGQLMQVENIQEVGVILKSICLAQNTLYDFQADSCQLARAAGASISQKERQQAIDALLNAEKKRQEQQDQAERRFDQASKFGFLDTLSNSLTQVQQQTGASIQNTAAQQQAAMASATQQRQQARTVAPRANSSVQATYGTQKTLYPQQGPCTDMSNSVSGIAKVNGNEVIGWLTNNSGIDLYVFYTFKQNGVPSGGMPNAGAGPLYAGRTNGGESAGMYSYSADTNPGMIYWYAVPLAQKNTGNCSLAHKW